MMTTMILQMALATHSYQLTYGENLEDAFKMHMHHLPHMVHNHCLNHDHILASLIGTGVELSSTCSSSTCCNSRHIFLFSSSVISNILLNSMFSIQRAKLCSSITWRPFLCPFLQIGEIKLWYQSNMKMEVVSFSSSPKSYKQIKKDHFYALQGKNGSCHKTSFSSVSSIH